jgi:raffinose synthase
MPAADHTRRLVSIQANAKFGGPEAGPEHSLNVSDRVMMGGPGCGVSACGRWSQRQQCPEQLAPPGLPPLPQSSGADLKAVVTALKQRYDVQYVYCWHAMPGFWGGLGLRDPEMAKYKVRHGGGGRGEGGRGVHARPAHAHVVR